MPPRHPHGYGRARSVPASAAERQSVLQRLQTFPAKAGNVIAFANANASFPWHGSATLAFLTGLRSATLSHGKNRVGLLAQA